MIPLAKISHLLTRVYVNQYDVSGSMNAAFLDIKPENARIETFSDTGPRRLPANYDHQARVAGFMEVAPPTGLQGSNIDKILFDLQSSYDHIVTELPALTEGGVSYDMLSIMDGNPRKWQNGQAVMLDASFQGSGGLARGAILRTGTVTGTGNGTGYQQVATTAGQVYAVVFRVLSGTFSSLALKIQESSDNGSGDAYVDIASMNTTFSVADTAAVARVTTTAATEAWKRVVVSGFTGTSAVVLVTGGVVAGT